MHQVSVLLLGKNYVLPLAIFAVCLLVTFPASADSTRQPTPHLSLDEADRECQKSLDTEECSVDVLPICQQAADLAAHGNERSRAALMLRNLGRCYIHIGKFQQAEISIRKGLAISTQMQREQHPDHASILDCLGIANEKQGKLVDAEKLLRHALAIRQKSLGQVHQDVSSSLNNLANVLGGQGKYAEAEELHRKALEIDRKYLGDAHLHVAIGFNNLALILENRGDYSEAEKFHRQSLGALQKLFGLEHITIATSLGNLATVLDNQGKYSDAEQYARRSLAIEQKLLGVDHPDIAGSYNNLATFIDHQGRHFEAELLYRRSVQMYQKFFGQDHQLLAIAITGLGSALHSQGKVREAEDSYRIALEMRQKVLKPQHPAIAISLHNLSTLFYDQRRLSEAEVFARKALEVEQKALGPKHPNVALSLSTLANILGSQGRNVEAEELHRQALAMKQEMLGPEHPFVALSLDYLAELFVSSSRAAEAVPFFRKAVAINDKQTRMVVSETRMQALLGKHRNEESAIYGLLLNKNLSGINELALRVALLRKGRLAEAGTLANRLVQQSLTRPAIKQRFAEWLRLRQQRESLLFEGMGKRPPDEYKSQLQNLQLQAESLEHALAVEMPELRTIQPPPMEEIVAQVAKRLPFHGVLVEVVWTQPFLGHGREDHQEWGSPHYIALLLFPDQRIEAVDLGEGSEIDGAASTLVQSLSRPLLDPKPAAKALYEQFFAKLGPHLKGRKDVYLSLDGSLHLIPFDALHDGTDYLLGRYKFHYLTSGRDLLRKPSSQPVGPALVIGNPYFGSSANSSPETASSVYQRLTTLSDLPWAQQEAETVAQLLGVRAVTGASAKEELLRERLAPSVVHLATHGLFLTDVAAPMSPGTRSALLMARPAVEKMPASTETPVSLPGLFGPMNRAALVFANARQGATAEDKSKDGLLTAEEARSLDLDGTQLVVLSACETGQGETSSGQGVYGLRRAFLIAGAETVVTSLWRVHDEATGELMTKYYGKLLDKEHPGDRLGAMIESMQELRARPGREHPYYWAPFLVIGADGPLRNNHIVSH